MPECKVLEACTSLVLPRPQDLDLMLFGGEAGDPRINKGIGGRGAEEAMLAKFGANLAL